MYIFALMKNRSLWISIGMLLFLVNFVSLILMIVGLQFGFMQWIDYFGRAWGLGIRLSLVIFGAALVYAQVVRQNE